MKKLIHTAVVLVCFITVLTTSVFADSIVNYQEGYVEFSLEIDNPGVNSFLTMVTKPHFSEAYTEPQQYGSACEIVSDDTQEQIKEKLHFTDNKMLLNGEAYEVNIPVAVDSPSGFYTIKIGITGRGAGEQSLYTDTFFYGNGRMQEYAFELIRDTEGEDTFEVLKKYSAGGECPILNIDLSTEEWETYMPVFEQMKIEMEFDDLFDAEAIHQSSIALMIIDESGISADVIEEYKDFLNFKTNEFYNEDVADDVAKLMEMYRIEAGGINSIVQINKFFDDALLLTAVNCANAESLTGVLDFYNETLELDYEDYDEYQINRQLIDRSYEDVETFKDAFEDAKKEIDKNEKEDDDDKKPNRGKGGGSSGGGRPSGSVTVFEPTKGTEEAEKEPIVETPEFTDIADVPWAKSGIEFLASKGITGKSKGIFAPNDMIAREECAKFLTAAFDVELMQSKTPTFDDTDVNAWYYPHVYTLYSDNVMKGIGDNKFGVGMEISRQDFFVIVYRVLLNENYNFGTVDKSNYQDGEMISDYAVEAIDALSSAGITEGSNGMILPLKGISRAEAAKVLDFAVQQLENGGGR